MQPIDTSGLFSQVGQTGPLFAFMLLVILALLFAVKALYGRNIMLGDKMMTVISDNTVSNNNSTLALTALTRQIEVLNHVR